MGNPGKTPEDEYRCSLIRGIYPTGYYTVLLSLIGQPEILIPEISRLPGVSFLAAQLQLLPYTKKDLYFFDEGIFNQLRQELLGTGI